MNGQTVTDFDDYGAVIFTDKDGAFDESGVSIDDLLSNEKSVMYSMSKNNIYSGDNGAIDIYYINNMLSTDFNKNTYAVFFVKNSEGKTYYSNVISNSYNSVAAEDTSDNANISQSIIEYSNALINYTNLVKKAEGEKG